MGTSDDEVNAPMIIDDGVSTGTWSTVTAAAGEPAIGRNGDTHESITPGDFTTFTFTGLTAGATYEIAATWEHNPERELSAYNNRVGYEVIDGGTRVALQWFNQTLTTSANEFGGRSFAADGSSWVRLETITATGTSLVVRVLNLDGGRVIADAVRLQQIAGDHGADDDLGFRVLSTSPLVDNGDPKSVYSSEPAPNGNRVNIGADGNTSQATSPNLALELLSPNGFDKLTIGQTVEIAWQSAGLKPLDPVLLLNAGGPTVGRFLASAEYRTAGSADSIESLVSLSGLTDPASQGVYQSFDTSYGIDSHVSYALPVPDGDYTLRVHFTNPESYSTETGQYLFDIRAEGNLLADDLDLFTVAGGANHGGVQNFTVHVSGGDGLSLDFVNESNVYLLVSGLELLRANATGTADPRADLQLSLDNGSTWTDIVTNQAFDRFGGGSYNWTVPAGSETVGMTALVRVASGATSDMSNHSLLIAPTGHDFYVNDNSTVGDVTFGASGTSAVGNDLNSGKSLDRPVASLIGLLNSYDFGPGDVIHVNTGDYLLLRNLVIGPDDAGVQIEGPATAVALLRRGADAISDDFIIDVMGADGVKISHLSLTDANIGVHATNSDGLQLRNLHAFGMTYSGVDFANGADLLVRDSVFESNVVGLNVFTSEDGAQILHNQAYGNSTGINVVSPGIVSDNHVFSNSTGIVAGQNGSETLSVTHNTVSGNGTGIIAVGGILVSANDVFGNSGTGIATGNGSTQVFDNDVWNNHSGIVTSIFANESVRKNRVYHNATVGIQANSNDVVDGNQVYGNATGVVVNNSAQVTRNLIYDNADGGVSINGGSTGLVLRNNTIVQPVGDAVHVQFGSYDVLLENNILTASDGFAISVDTDSQVGFASDYNLLQFPVGTMDGGLGEWQTRDFDSLTRWQFELGLDRHSRVANPNFNDPNGTDNLAGFSTAPVGAVQIIDNDDSGFSTVGTWDFADSGLNGSEVNSTATSVSASWQFTGLVAGATYELAVTWFNDADVTAGIATYFVFDGDTLVAQPRINQAESNPNDFMVDGANWERLGTFVLDSTSLTLTLKPPTTTGHAFADAVRLQRIEGNGGVDDVVGYLLQSNSPAIDNGNPLTPFTFEPQTNGNRVNIGHQGGTTTATLSPASQVQLVSPNGNEKHEAGSTVPIQWQIAGVGATDPLAVLNVGGGQAGFFAPDQFQTAGYAFPGTTTESVNISGADLPAPAAVYQSWKSAEYGAGKHLTFHLPIADGTYTVRLHFAEPTFGVGAADRKFDIVLNGDTAADDFDIFSAAGGIRRAVTRTFTVDATGGEGITVDLVSETANYEAILSGLEVLLQNASGQSDPRATLEFSIDNGSTWSVIEDDLPHDRFGHGKYLWTVPANVAAAGDSAKVRVSVNPTDTSDGSFLIVNGGHDFYINDGSTTGDVFTSAVGNDLNSGKTAATPMANLAALLDAYDLGPGDVIHVDTDNYLVLRNIVIGADDAGVRIEGPAGETVRAIFDRDLEGQQFSRIFEVVGADNVTIDSVGITGANVGLVASHGTDHLTLSHNQIFGNANTGVRLDTDGHGHRIEDNQILNNGSSGLSVFTDALVKGNQVSGQDTGIQGNNNSETLLQIRDNTVTGNSVGIFVASHVLVSGNTVAGHTTGAATGISVYFGAEASHNIVFGNVTGIVSTAVSFTTERIFGNRVYFNSGTGIIANYFDTVDSNAVYSNSTGILLSGFSGSVVNNLVYANSNFGIVINGNNGQGPSVINNSVFQDVGDALRLNSTTGVQVFNNILWVNAGRAIFVDSGSQSGFTSDRNLVTRGPNPIAPGENASVGFFNGANVITLSAFQAASGKDLHSVEVDPNWIDINGADNVLGYSTAGVGYDGGADDNFGLFRDSPAIDRGNGDVAPNTDFLGAARHDDPGTPDTGVGDPTFADIGAFEFLGDSDDVLAPTVLSSSPVTLHAGGNVSQARRSFTFTFSEPLNAVDARAATNFSIRSPGLNGTFDEVDDMFFPVTPTYTLGATTATVTIPDLLELGIYRLTISGNTSIHDSSANKLDGDNNGVEGGDYVREFTVVPNTAPTADNDSATTAEDADLTLAPSDLLTGDNDPDSDPLSIVVVTGPSHGTLTPTDEGGLLYSPDDDYFGDDSFTYRATDGLATSNLATVSLTITPVNDAPIAVNDAYDVSEDGDLIVSAALGVLANDSDIDTVSASRTVTVVENQGVQHGQLTLNSNGSFNYSPGDNFFGTDSFTYEVSDGDKTDQATVTITVLAVNDTPVAVNDRYQIDVGEDLETSAFTGVLHNDTDSDFDSLTAMLVSDVSHGTLDFHADGSFTYMPTTGFVGTDHFTYKANDGTVDSNTATVTIVVDSFNAEIHGVKFQDQNSNGVRDPGTPAVPGDVAEFNWQAIASVQDLNSPLFGNPAFNAFPYTILNGGQGVIEIFSGFETIAAELADPLTDLTFTFGDTTAPYNSSAPGLVLDHFDNGVADGVAKQFFQPESGVTDNTFRLFNHNVLVASGVIQEVVVETTHFSFQGHSVFQSHGHGSVLFTAAGADPTIFNEIVSLSGGTGILEFFMSSFDFAGVVSGLQEGSLFSTDGSVTNLGDDGSTGVPGESLLGGFTIVAFQDLDGDGVLDEGPETPYSGTSHINTGEYTITGLPAGTYLVQELPVENYTQTFPNEAAHFQYVVTLTAGQSISGKDFGNLFVDPMTSEIHGLKWNDVNGNGYRDGVGSPDSVVVSTVDDAGAANPDSVTVYLAAGDPLTFSVSVTMPQAASFVFVQVVGDDHFVFQPVNPQFVENVDSGVTVTFQVTLETFGAGFSDDFELRFTDFGTVFGTTTIHVTTPELEPLLAGWTIYLDANDNKTLDEDGDGVYEAGEEHFTTTNANGEYAFTGLSGGVYHVREVLQSGYQQTFPGPLYDDEHLEFLDPDSVLTGIDFGNQLANHEPIAMADQYEVAEDGTLNGSSVLTNDDDDDDDTLTAVLNTNVSHGVLDLHSDGTFTYSPTQHFNGSDSFTYHAFDGLDASNIVTVTITITEVNDAPNGANDHLSSIAEDSGVRTISFASLLGNDSKGPTNENGQTLIVSAVSNPVGGTVEIDGTDVKFTPTEHFNGAASFTYTLRDNGTTHGAHDFKTSTANVSFTITEVNDAPTGVNDSLSPIGEDSTVRTIPFATLLGNDSKGPDNESGQTLTITGVSDAVGGTVEIIGTDLKFTPTPQFNGPASFIYTLRDNGTTNGVNNFLTSTASVSFSVSGVNDAPNFTKGPDITRPADGEVKTFTGWATNISRGAAFETGQTVNFIVSATNATALFLVAPQVSADGVLTFTPKSGNTVTGTSTVSVQIHDNGGGADTSGIQTFTITLTGLNKIPTFTKGANQTTTEDVGQRTVTGWATAISAGVGDTGQQVQFMVTTNTNTALFSEQPTVSSTGVLTYTPAPNANGTASITLVLKDDGGKSATNGGQDTSAVATFTITVTPINDAPTFMLANTSFTVFEDAVAQSVANFTTNLNRGAANESAQTLSFLVTNDNAGLFKTAPAISPAGILTYTLNPNANGQTTVTVRAKDNGGGTAPNVDTSAPQTFMIHVTSVNDAPSFTKGANQSFAEDTATHTIANWATLIKSGPTADETGQAVDFRVTTSNDGAFAELPTVSPTGTLSYRTAADFAGVVTVTVNLHDNGGTDNSGVDLSAAQTFTITATEINDAPSFTLPETTVTVLEDVAAQSVANFAANLSKGPASEAAQTLIFTVTNNNAALFKTAPAISPTGTLTYTLNPNAVGSAVVSVLLKDNGSGTAPNVNASATQTFNISVTPVNDAPSFTKGANQTAAEDIGLRTVANWATKISAGPTDEAGQAVDFRVTTSNDSFFAELPAVASNGTLTYRTAQHAVGTVTVTVVLHDNGATENNGVDLSVPQTFTIAASAVNDAPERRTGTLPTINVDEDSTNGTAVTLGLNGVTYAPGPATATDEAAQTLAYKITAIPKAITLFKADGTTPVNLNAAVTAAELQGLKFKTVANLFGTVNLKFTVTDSGGIVANVNPLTETIIVTVNPLNDASPTIVDIPPQTTAEDKATAAIKVTINDVDDVLVNLNAVIVTATSSNEALVPNTPTNIVIGGTLANRTIQLVPLADQNGTTTITVTATDSSGAATAKSFLLTVTAVSDAPRVTPVMLTVPEFTTNGASLGTVPAFDPDTGDTITYAITAGNTNAAFAINPTTGEITVNDATKIDFEALAAYTLTVTVTDNHAVKSTAPVTINVTDQSVPFQVDLTANQPNSVTVLRVGNTLVVRQTGVADRVAPTRLDDVGVVTIEGANDVDTVVLDVSLNTAGTPVAGTTGTATSIKFKGQLVFNGHDGNDTLTATAITVTNFTVLFDGGAGADVARGGAESDTFVGGAGNDVLAGGKGNDTYRFADLAADATDETDTLPSVP